MYIHMILHIFIPMKLFTLCHQHDLVQGIGNILFSQKGLISHSGF